MKTLARWGSRNILAARIIIAMSHIAFACIACYAGIILCSSEQVIPIQLFWISGLAFILIPIVSNKLVHRGLSFYKRKTIEGAVLICSFIMIMTLANQKNTSNFTFYASVHGSFSKEKTSVSEKPSFRQLKKEFKELRSIIKKNKPSAGAVFGAVLVGLFLASLVVTLSCSLLCSEQGGLALLVLLAGFTGIFFVIKLLLKPRKDPKKKVPDETPKPAILG